MRRDRCNYIEAQVDGRTRWDNSVRIGKQILADAASLRIVRRAFQMLMRSERQPGA